MVPGAILALVMALSASMAVCTPPDAMPTEPEVLMPPPGVVANPPPPVAVTLVTVPVPVPALSVPHAQPPVPLLFGT